MLEVAIMIEGQNGLTWPRWQKIARAVEDLGFIGLYRSDHYTNASPPDKASLELWTSLTWLACNTSRIEFGPLVSPFSFREPTMTARMALAVDDLSNGRLTLGLGAGWQDREHKKFGHNLLELGPRFDRFEDGLEVVSKLLQSDEPVSHKGAYYELNDALLLPRPQRAAGPPILIGGNGPKRTAQAVVDYASEWNAIFLPPADFAERNAKLDALLDKAGRPRDSVRRSMMTGCYFGETTAAVQAKLPANRSIEEVRARGVTIGTASEIIDHLGTLADAGLQRVMLQWLDLDDLDGLEKMATAILSQMQ